MKIVDAHAHLGKSDIFCLDYKFEDLLNAMDENEVWTSVVQPIPGDPKLMACHEEIAVLSEKYPGRIYGYACFDPYLNEDEYVEKATWALRDLKFKGLKIHTNGYGISPVHPSAAKIFRVANEFKASVMVHTGTGIPHSVPSLCITPARQYPDMPIILAHAGGGIFTSDAIVAAQVCDNIFLEATWTISVDILPIVEAIGANRVMFGSDAPSNIVHELLKFRKAGLTEDQLSWCLEKTARKVLKLCQ